MPSSDPVERAVVIKHVIAEIDRLSEQQMKTMQKARVVGMTHHDAKEYNERRARIADLVKQLAMITRRRVS